MRTQSGAFQEGSPIWTARAAARHAGENNGKCDRRIRAGRRRSRPRRPCPEAPSGRQVSGHRALPDSPCLRRGRLRPAGSVPSASRPRVPSIGSDKVAAAERASARVIGLCAASARVGRSFRGSTPYLFDGHSGIDRREHRRCRAGIMLPHLLWRRRSRRPPRPGRGAFPDAPTSPSTTAPWAPFRE